MDEEEERERAEKAGLNVDEYMGLVSAIDSMIAVAPQLMRALFTQYEAALEAGFNEEQAFALVMQRAQGWLS